MTQQSDMQNIAGESMDLTEHNIEQIRQIFPNVFTEGKIDFDALQAELGEVVEKENERYQFTWNGKEQAKRIATTPTLGTLRPCQEESVDWDNTENIFIEGDNLEVLKLLQKSYFGKVKMIYIDPPYNTGKDFVYKDNFKDNIANYKRLTGQADEEGSPLTTNSDSAGHYHTRWLNMIYPRLKLARNLLTDDGVIFIHIGKHEVVNLSIICREIFGEANQLGTMIWDKGNPKGDSNSVAYQHESIIAFTKNASQFKENVEFERSKKNAQKIINKAKQLFKKIGKKTIKDDLKQCSNAYELNIDLEKYEFEYELEDVNDEFQAWLTKQPFSNGEKAYKFIDMNGFVFQSVSMAWPNKKKAPDEYFIPLIHPKTAQECPVPEKGWRNPPGTMSNLLSKDLVLFGVDETTQPRRKYFLHENMNENIPSILYFGGSDDELMKTFDLSFDNPKPYLFAKELVSYVCEKEDIILDFFAGSATTAHAVMTLNAEDGGRRKCISVQIPEPTPEKSEARRKGYEDITEISKQRVRMAKKQIIEEYPDTPVDLGFKVFKLDTSNIKMWKPESDASAEKIHEYVMEAVDNIVDGRTSEDLLYEVLIKYGLPLTYPVESITVNNHQAWLVAGGALVACFDEGINLDTVKEIAELKTDEIPLMRVVFRDTSFADDTVKTNAIQHLKQYSIEDVLSI